MRILAVDDAEAAVRCLGKLLEMEGHDVCLTLNGRSAIEMATSFRPDLILLDVAMPVVTRRRSPKRFAVYRIVTMLHSWRRQAKVGCERL